jgi:hypothetical protein
MRCHRNRKGGRPRSSWGIYCVAMAKQPEVLEPLTLPVATVDSIPGRTTVRYVGPAFGIFARSMGFTKGFTGDSKRSRVVRSRSSRSPSRPPDTTPSSG